MGIYMPIKEIPPSCWACDVVNECIKQIPEIPEGCEISRFDDKRPEFCPLIDINLVRCGECVHYELPFNCTDKEPTDFCSKGERRADEHTDKRD